MIKLSLTRVLKIMIKTTDYKKITKYNVYLQQMINAMFGPIIPTLLKSKREYLTTGKLPSETEPKATLNLTDNVVILNSVALWINNDIKSTSPELQRDLKLMLKLVKEAKANKHLEMSELPNDA